MKSSNHLPVQIKYLFISEEFHVKYYESYLSKLPLRMREKIMKFKRWQDAQASLLGNYLILNNVLNGDICKLTDIQYNKCGKPFILGFPHFNISHSGNIVVFVSSEHKIGIDVELVKDIDVDDFKLQMTNSEWNKIQFSLNKTAAFYEYWTQKEAVIKANGKGLNIPLKSFEINSGLTLIEEEKFYVKKVPIDQNYMCHLAIKSIFQSDIFFDIEMIRYPQCG